MYFFIKIIILGKCTCINFYPLVMMYPCLNSPSLCSPATCPQYIMVLSYVYILLFCGPLQGVLVSFPMSNVCILPPCAPLQGVLSVWWVSCGNDVHSFGQPPHPGRWSVSCGQSSHPPHTPTTAAPQWKVQILSYILFFFVLVNKCKKFYPVHYTLVRGSRQ